MQKGRGRLGGTVSHWLSIVHYLTSLAYFANLMACPVQVIRSLHLLKRVLPWGASHLTFLSPSAP